jgi:catechol 2,3-dioxygenase
MPSRRDLGRWLVHAGIMNVPLTGFADHLVSEAVYLDDPEGNGIEVYRDRPREEWRWNGGMVDMASEPLDVDGIVASIGGAREPFRSAPAGTRIGHVHLKVGSVVEGFSFYGDGLGLSPTRAGRADSAFLSSGGYHHHLAMNVWDSPGAGRRDDAATGLDWLSLETHEQRTPGLQAARLRLAGYAVSDGGRGFEAVDPWGTRVRMDLI